MPKKVSQRLDYTVAQKMSTLLTVGICTAKFLDLLRERYPALESLSDPTCEVAGCYNHYAEDDCGSLKNIHIFVNYGKKKIKPKEVYKQNYVFKFSSIVFVKNFIEKDIFQLHNDSVPSNILVAKPQVNSVNFNRDTQRLEVNIWRTVEL